MAYLYKDKDVRHGSIEITVHRRCIPMWKARWTLNSHWPSEREEAEATEFTVPPGMHRSNYLIFSSHQAHT